jgi:hypothetical protein
VLPPKIKTTAALRLCLLLALLCLPVSGAPEFHGVLAWNFDWDDNIMFMKTKIVVFRKGTKEEKEVSTGDFAVVEHQLGQPGTEWEDWEQRRGDGESYRYFRDSRGKNNFLDQVMEAMAGDPALWRGPSWDAFIEACSRPETARRVTIITARGHSPSKIWAALKKLQEMGIIKYVPPVGNLIPVDHKKFRTDESTSARKAVHMKRFLDEIQKRKVYGKADVVNRDGTGRAKLHLWGFSDDSFANFERAKKDLGEAIAADPKRWDKIKITLFYTGTKEAGVEPHAVVLDSSGQARPLNLAEELGEAKRLLGDKGCDTYYDWLLRLAPKSTAPR